MADMLDKKRNPRRRLTEEEVIPTSSSFSEEEGYVEGILGLPACELSGTEDTETEEEEDGTSLTVPKMRPSQEELIKKLLHHDMSFNEVATLWGEGDSDMEDSIASSNVGDEDHAAEFEKELNQQQRYQLKRKGGVEKRRRRRLPAALQGLMGEANLRYARCEYDEAIKMCMEVIRQYSHSPEPYQTLGMIYEEKKMVNKSLQFLLIAAFLSPNAEEWEKLAELSLNQGDLQQAAWCWGRAIRANPQNLDYHWLRCELLEQLGEKAKALKGYTHMLKFLAPDQGVDGLKLAKEIAKIHFENKDIHLAREAMETAFRKYPSCVSPEDINLMLEVLMHQQEYLRCVEILVMHGGVHIKSDQIPQHELQGCPLEERLTLASEVSVPDDLLIDLRTKLTAALIHLQAFDLAVPLVELLMLESQEDFGDLYLDVAEAYMSVNKHQSALPLLRPLITSQHYSVAAVWLQYGESLAATDHMDEAAEAYNQVVKLAPQHAEARLTLSGILQSLGKLDEALLILNQQSDLEPLDSQILYQRCKILLNQGLTDQFINAAKLLFRRHFMHIRNRDEAEAMLSNKKLNNKYEAIRELRRSKSEPLEDSGPAYTGTDVPLDQQWDLFCTVCNILYEKKRYDELERMTFSALGSKEFMRDKDRAREVEFMCLLACIYNDSSYSAYNIMRELVIKNPESTRCWNLLNLIISKADDFRHNRFLLRLTHKHPDLVSLGLLNGHNCLVAGTYKYSLAEYTQAFKQLNLLPQAIHYYKRALDCHPPETNPGSPELDLTREVAYNLALIYQNSGANNLARMYLYKYIQV
ncbi:unnamed protein product [Meganyctiphanes norvegica]|uniref:General transcription factor 3C polypeptide 3 n=1 Tax=Meganyctiphanes norvegica TaxID=48144 RepID=A0AAV2QR24_MEGNR